jgi:hypothetical protein
LWLHMLHTCYLRNAGSLKWNVVLEWFGDQAKYVESNTRKQMAVMICSSIFCWMYIWSERRGSWRVYLCRRPLRLFHGWAKECSCTHKRFHRSQSTPREVLHAPGTERCSSSNNAWLRAESVYRPHFVTASHAVPCCCSSITPFDRSHACLTMHYLGTGIQSGTVQN